MLRAIPPSECMRARESVSARLDGELSELEAAGLDKHLHACAECSAFARELHALSAELCAAPLEQPKITVFAPARRRPLVRLQTAVAAAAIVAVAAGSSFTVTGTAGADFLSLQADSNEQHILAMRRRLEPSDSLRSGRVIAV